MQMIQQADIVFLREQMRTKELVYRYIIYVELLKLLYITAVIFFLDSSPKAQNRQWMWKYIVKKAQHNAGREL